MIVKKHLMPLLGDLLITALLTLALFLVLGLPATLIVSLLGGNGNIAIYIALALSYPPSFYLICARRHGERVSKRLAERYRLPDDLRDYLSGEGKYLLGIYLAAAVIAVACHGHEALRAVTLALCAVFPLGLLDLNAPWLIAVCAPLSAALSLALMMLGRRRAWHFMYEEDNRLSESDRRNAAYLRRILQNRTAAEQRNLRNRHSK